MKKKVDTIFQVSGGGSIFLGDALYKAKKIKYVAHHHEQAASFAAEVMQDQKMMLVVVLLQQGQVEQMLLQE